MTRIAAILAASVAVLGIAALAFLALRGKPADVFAECRGGAVATGTASIGGPFTLTGGSGARVTEAEAITRPTLLYFGYTFCPDFCPNDLARNAVAADILTERGTDLGLVFVTIDPERDAPEAMDAYARAIHPDMLGLSGSPEDIAAAAKAYRVYYRKAGDDPEFYLMDHSTFTYLVAPGQPFLEFYPSDATPEAVADSVSCYVDALAGL
ncbi:SCO family protein [Amaricoccus sp.]|uniref:SCO family protein n=1 Tax=Amaricoccus sp. TaxID=1872485 RepID=UPI001B449ADE|nr:SCO family protein [Amaricoccus sp.]MBP7003693.1 SCO family protein [Amaricoccus sp.]